MPVIRNGCLVAWLVLLSFALVTPALSQTIGNAYPAPYPSTTTPEVLPLELGVPIQAPPAPTALPSSTTSPTEPTSPESVDLSLEVTEEPQWYTPSYWFRPPGWDTSIELGLNGASGTSESFSLRTGVMVKRESEFRKVDFNIYHNRTKAGGIETQNNAQAKFRHDWLLADSPWTVYAQSQVFYDEFQSFDLNLNLNGGMGYRWIDTDSLDFTTRAGSGVLREFGGNPDEWVPEAQLGIDYEQKIADTQKLYATVDYFPQWESFGKYRVVTDIGWEVELAVPSNVSLKIAATDRYDSEPDGADPHNLNYSVLLLWKL